MNRRFLFSALAAVAVLALFSASDVQAKLRHEHGNACEAFAGNDPGPSSCCGGGDCCADSCCKAKKSWSLFNRCCKPKCCEPACCEPVCCKPKRCCKPKCCAPAPTCCDTCDSCCDPCCRPRPLRDLCARLKACCD